MHHSGTLRSILGGLAGAAFWILPPISSAEDPTTTLVIRVEAGRFDREQTPVQISIPIASLGEEWAERLDQLAERRSPLPIRAQEGSGALSLAQVDRIGEEGEHVRLLWVLEEPLPGGSHRSYQVDLDAEAETDSPWTFRTTEEGQLDLSRGEDPVFRYNASPVSHPDFPHPNQPRNAYIHPAFSPSGAVVTGDYSAGTHPHHRGFFLAYTKTSVGELEPDFWNIQRGSGKVHFDRFGEETVGPVSARFSTFHRWEARPAEGDPVVVLRERWEVETFDIPGTPYRLIDLASIQQAESEPLILPPYRYGGMAYRGPDSFLPEGALDVLTSEGFDRVRGDQEPARWVDLTGPVGGEADSYAGAAILDHPSNVNHPTPARIHPTRIPFFCFVPGHDEEVAIGPEAPTVFRYRILIHDGRPDLGRNDRLWNDFAEPPKVAVTIEPSS